MSVYVCECVCVRVSWLCVCVCVCVMQYVFTKRQACPMLGNSAPTRPALRWIHVTSPCVAQQGVLAL